MKVPSLLPILACLASLAIGACGSDEMTAPANPGLRIVRGDGATDTVLTKLTTTLLIEVVSETGTPAVGTEVRFRPLEKGGYPDVYVTPADDTTNGQGRVAVQIQLGVHAGMAKLVISAVELGLEDTARFTVLPGNAELVVV